MSVQQGNTLTNTKNSVSQREGKSFFNFFIFIIAVIAIQAAVFGSKILFFDMSVEPKAYIDTFDIPPGISAAFSTPTTFYLPSAPGSDSSAAKGLAWSLSGLVLGISLLICALRMSFIPLIVGVAILASIAGGPSLLHSIDGRVNSAEPGRNLQKLLMVSSVSGMENLVRSIDGLPEAEVSYLLAQMSLHDRESPWVAQALQSLRDPATAKQLNVPGQVAYAIETAAGVPVEQLSETAKAYALTAVEIGKTHRNTGIGLLLLSGALFSICVIRFLSCRSSSRVSQQSLSGR